MDNDVFEFEFEICFVFCKESHQQLVCETEDLFQYQGTLHTLSKRNELLKISVLTNTGKLTNTGIR